MLIHLAASIKFPQQAIKEILNDKGALMAIKEILNDKNKNADNKNTLIAIKEIINDKNKNADNKNTLMAIKEIINDKNKNADNKNTLMAIKEIINDKDDKEILMFMTDLKKLIDMFQQLRKEIDMYQQTNLGHQLSEILIIEILKLNTFDQSLFIKSNLIRDSKKNIDQNLNKEIGRLRLQWLFFKEKL